MEKVREEMRKLEQQRACCLASEEDSLYAELLLSDTLLKFDVPEICQGPVRGNIFYGEGVYIFIRSK